MKAIITVGISGSGKTTFAKEWAKANNGIISNRDDLRFGLTGATSWGDYKFKKENEEIITRIQEDTFEYAECYGRNLIVADTNLDTARRNKLVKTLEELKFDVEIKPFPITLEEAWKRNTLRTNGVGRDILYKQWQQWNKFINRRVYQPNKAMPKAVIFDVDGTLMHMNGRGPFEWDKVGTDTVDIHVQNMLWSYHIRGYKIIILSGRDGVCYDLTFKSLTDNGIIWDLFIMREAGDSRKDTIIKEEIFWRDVAPYYNVEVVFDDRPCVVRMWQDLGIPKVIAVGDQSEEF